MITDFELHAFVDDQLAGEESAQVLEETSRSQALARRLAALQRLKRLVQSAYPGQEEDALPEADRDAPDGRAGITL